MPMQVESLEVLEKASVAPAQARAIVRAIELEIAGAKDTLATKHDLLGLQQGFEVLRREFDALRREFEALKRDFDALKRGLDELRAEVHRSVGGVQTLLFDFVADVCRQRLRRYDDVQAKAQSPGS